MAWRSNILQKSFVRDCSSLLKNDLRFTRRWQSLQLAVACCAFCALFMCYQKCLNFAVLKVLPSGDWWVLSAVSVEIHQTLFLKWISVLSSILFVWRCTRSIRYDAVVRLWLMLSAVCFWSGMLDAVNRLLLKQHRFNS
jgi:hypothetical protein